MASKIVITDAGLAEVLNATHTGTSSVALTEVGLGTGQYVASADREELQAEFKRLATISGGAVDDDLIHFTVLDDSADAYSVYEFGVYTEKGTLFAVYSQVTPIVQKASGSQAILAIDIKLADISATSLTIGDANFVMPPATTTQTGLVELATKEEAIDGQSAILAMTPYTTKMAIDDRHRDVGAERVRDTTKPSYGLVGE